jgi:two-component system, OmpR family, response regulator
LVSEIALPEEDGFALIRHVRTLGGSWGEVVPVIAVTAYITKEMRQRALLCGFDHWLTKPLDLDAFVAVLASLAIRQPSGAIGLAPTCQIVRQLSQVPDSSHVLHGIT